jgi:hypothetical protein
MNSSWTKDRVLGAGAFRTLPGEKNRLFVENGKVNQVPI